jgi:hypothetical protein
MVASNIPKQSVSHCGDQIMEPRHLYTIKWTQPYATYQMRPYLRHLRNEYEAQIEAKLARGEFDDAKQIIERIKDASKS